MFGLFSFVQLFLGAFCAAAFSNDLSNIISAYESQRLNGADSSTLMLPQAHFVTEPLKLQNMKYTIIGTSDTSIASSGNQAATSTITLENSTLSLSTITFLPESVSTILSLTKNSNADLLNVKIQLQTMKNSLFFVDDSTLSFKNLDLGDPTTPVAPLVSCSLSQSNLRLSDSTFSSFTTSGPDALFGSKNARTVAVTRCSFSNITMASTTQKMSADAPQQHSASISNKFDLCDNVYEGNILTGLRASNFRAFNSTHNQDRTVHRERTVPDQAFAMISSEDYIFCLAEQNNGGAIAISVQSTLMIDDCNFISCRAAGSVASTGGAIAFYGYGPGMMTLANSNFNNCSSTLYAGALAIEGGATVQNCTFTDCSSQFGGAMYLNLSLFDTTVDSIVVDHCTTTDTGRGGAIYVWGMDASNLPLTVVFSNSEFKKCEATVNGGAFYFSQFQRTTMSFNLQLSFTGLSFKENDLDTDDHAGCANDIAAEKGWWGILTEDCFTDCTSKSSHNHIVIRTMDGTQEYEYHNDWMEDKAPMEWYWLFLIITLPILFVCVVALVIVCAIRRVLCFAPKENKGNGEYAQLSGDLTDGDGTSGTSMATLPPENQY